MSSTAMRKARVDPSLAGQYLAKTLYERDTKRALIRSGTRLSESLLHGLMRHGITDIWVTDAMLSDLEIRETVHFETREITKTALQNVYANMTKPGATHAEHATALVDVARRLVDDILRNDNVLHNIERIRSWDSYTFEHSIQVAIIAIIIGRELCLTPEQLQRLGIGAMLHDIGKVLIPQEILNKQGSLTDDEFDVMKTHTTLGWHFVHERFAMIMPTSSIVIIQHHERLDGSGYPQGLRDHQIHSLSKIVAVADVFDAMRAARIYRERRMPKEVLTALTRDAGLKLDARMVKALLSRVALVSQGEIVRLSNGLLAFVTEPSMVAPLEPQVRVVADEDDTPIRRYDWDLRDSGYIVEKTLDQWPAKVLKSVE
ncbi:MAG: HD-GYP domain-containing protein [Bacilli bacterium]